MLKRKIAALLVCLTLFALAATSHAKLKYEPMDEAIAKLGFGGNRMYCRIKPDMEIGKVPEGAENVKGGTFCPDGFSSVGFIIYGETANKPEALVFDINEDGDFSNDPVHTDFTESIKGKIASGSEFDLKIQIMMSGMMVTPNEPRCWKGKVRVDEKRVLVALIDLGGDGFDNKGIQMDMMLYDTNGNGKFDLDIARYSGINEMKYIGPEISIDGKLYSFEILAEKRNLKITPYEGPQGKLALDLKLKKNPEEFQCLIYSMSAPSKPGERGEMLMLSGSKADFPLAVKVGQLPVSMGMITFNTQDGGTAMMQFSTEQPLAVEEGKTQTLSVGAHDPFTLTVTQVEGKINVGQTFTGQGGIKYSQIITMPKDMDTATFRPSGPKVRILNADGDLLAEGSMEYG